MKKFFCLMALAMTLLMLPTVSLAAMPDISAGETRFDISSGCYILKNNVRVVARGRTMTAHEAKVSLTSQKVWAQGAVTLEQDGIVFQCDSIYVQGLEKTVDVLGNVQFDATELLKITSEVAKFSWSTKIADFYGGVSLDIFNADNLKFADGVDRNFERNRKYDHVQYNVVEKKIMLIENKTSAEPKVNMPELRIEIE